MYKNTEPLNTVDIDVHIGKRIHLRRTMLGMTQKDLASKCGVTFQQIQKYETAANRISASRLFRISGSLDTPVAFFFSGLPESDNSASRLRVSSPDKAKDPLESNETLMLINLYWRLPNDEARRNVLDMLKILSGGSTPSVGTNTPAV